MTKDHTHLPENVQAILKALPVHDQVVLRSYIASLRENVKDMEHKLLAEEDEDPHAHYHGHDKCTADHGHDSHDSHSHHAKEEACTDEGHEHSHSHKKEEDAACGGEDGHDHEHKHAHEPEHKHEHKHEHEHAHNHDHKKEEDIPAWKKKALESGSDDPMAAPFGGSWNVEASVDATKDK